MSHVVLKRLGDDVALISSRLFASKREALEELATVLTALGEDPDAEYLVFDVESASPVLLLPQEPEVSSNVDSLEAAFSAEIPFDEVPVEADAFDLVSNPDAVGVLELEVVTDELLPDLEVERILLPEPLSGDLTVDEVIIEDVFVEGAEEPELDEGAELERAEGPGVGAVDVEAPDVAAAVPDEPTAAGAKAEAEEVAASDTGQESTDEVETTSESVADVAEEREPAPALQVVPEPVADQAADDAEPEPEPKNSPEPIPVPDPVPEPEPDPEPEMPGYEAGDSDLTTLTCEDCVYITTCPNKEERTPSGCGSFQWVSV